MDTIAKPITYQNIFRTKLSKHAFFGLGVSIITLIIGVCAAAYTQAGSINLNNIILAQKSNAGVWIMDAFPFIFSIWGQYARLVSARKALLLKAKQTYHAKHDSLTHLPNRFLLLEKVENTITKTEQNPFAIIIIKIKQLNEITTSIGWQESDMLLKAFVSRLHNILKAPNQLARIGSNEFCVLSPNLKETHEINSLLIKITNTLKEAFTTSQHTLTLNTAIGGTLYPEHGDNPNTLLQNASIATQSAKENNTPFRLYSQKMARDLEMTFTLKNDLPKAIAQQELILYYQPIVNLKTKRIIGSEALVRWQHPRLGFIPPDKFIQLAESTGHINDLTQWVLNESIQQCAKWQSEHPLILSVNLSPHDIKDPTLPNVLQKILAKHKLPPQFITLELTENALMSDEKTSIQVLQQLSDIGFKIAIDDFGTGYSSLKYLSTLPVNKLKIDRSFVMNLYQTPNNAIIVKTIVDLAHNLNMKAVAEGIENKTQYEHLTNIGCDIGQGYFISKPVPSKDFIPLLQENQKAVLATKSLTHVTI